MERNVFIEEGIYRIGTGSQIKAKDRDKNKAILL